MSTLSDDPDMEMIRSRHHRTGSQSKLSCLQIRPVVNRHATFRVVSFDQLTFFYHVQGSRVLLVWLEYEKDSPFYLIFALGQYSRRSKK